MVFTLASWCRAQMTIALRVGGEQMNYLGQPWRARAAAARYAGATVD